MHDFTSGRRPSTIGDRAMVATSHPLATATALGILRTGGNAIDAAVAAAAVQAVVDPLMTGAGGDLFALYAPATGGVQALNASGRSPAAETIETLTQAGIGDTIPQHSPHAVTVPGAVSGWCRLVEELGSLPLAEVLAPAISYARDGFRITPRVAQDWAEEAATLRHDPHAAAHFLPRDTPPRPGDRFAQPALAGLLSDIAAHGTDGFYTGPNARSMVARLHGLGGLHTLDDFAEGADAATWVTPISARYRGVTVHECPPNGQGVAALLILRLLDGFDVGAMSMADRIHLQAEAAKIAYHHRDALLGDPADCPGLVETLLSDTVVEGLRARIDMTRAATPALWDEPEHRDTIYLCVVDEAGNAVSLINSIFHGFGSGLYDPGTGVLFHSRGASFRMIPGHPNAAGPRKRPMHTIIPGYCEGEGFGRMPFGVMGGQYQAAGQAALLCDVLARGMGLQAAMDEPRSFATEGVLRLEPGVPEEVRADLAARGHRIVIVDSPMGGSQAIRLHPEGWLEGGSDSRKDGMALGY